jgi:hypothetical protein
LGKLEDKLAGMKRAVPKAVGADGKPIETPAGVIRDPSDAAYAAAKLAALRGFGKLPGFPEWEKKKKEDEPDAKRKRTTEFIGIAEYAKLMQSSIGGAPPEVKIQKDIKADTAKMIAFLKKVAEWGGKTFDVLSKPRPATTT